MACQNQSSGAMVFFVPREPCSGVLHLEQLPSASVSPLLCSGEVAATFLPLHGSLKATLQGCPGLLTPCLGEFSPSPLLLTLAGVAGAASVARWTPGIWERIEGLG